MEPPEQPQEEKVTNCKVAKEEKGLVLDVDQLSARMQARRSSRPGETRPGLDMPHTCPPTLLVRVGERWTR